MAAADPGGRPVDRPSPDRHPQLGATIGTDRRRDGLAPLVRIELAVEHVLRLGLVNEAGLRCRGRHTIGDQRLTEVMIRRGIVNPTESYAETRAVQVIRSFGYQCFRQVPVWECGRIVHRIDIVIPFVRVRRLYLPTEMTPQLGLGTEVDSKEFHIERFEEDRLRQLVYDRHALHWISVTPNQVEFKPADFRMAIEGAMRRAMSPTTLKKVPKSAEFGL